MAAKPREIDYTLFFVVFGLIIFGMIMISSVSVYPSFKITSAMVALGKMDAPSNSFYLMRNMIHVFTGLLVFVGIIKTPYTFFERHARSLFILGLASLVAVLFVGDTLNGAKGWLNVPLLPFLLQPVEFVKLILIIYLASFLKKRRERFHTFQYGFFPFSLVVLAVFGLLALQPDFGSILIIAPIALVLFFVGGGNVRYIALALVAMMIFAYSIYAIGKHTTGAKNSLSYISDRIDNFLADNKSLIQNKTINFQTEQGLIAIGSGGFFGLGFGKSIQKFGYLPEVEGDFIFSVIAEELGFFGILVLVGCYLFIAYRGFVIAGLVKDPFAQNAAIGITSWIIVQTFINMGVNLNIIPLTGVTLPFISYGGSSLVSLLIGVGILLNISRYAEIPEARAASRFGRGFGKRRVI